MKVDLLNKRPFQLNAPFEYFLKRVNFNGEVSNKRRSHISHAKKEKEMMLNIDIHWKFTILSFVFGRISLSFLAACRVTLSPFSQTCPERHISQVPPSKF